ncbi:hypothetical protein BK673_10615 [Pseudomonas fluorescens]|jgi:uncharacterized RDD family membrane protein YckC|uniref:RDD domain-containing protein n=1 Tax=Pseudomonas fluorescens TaxID=294 RepID=A0A423P6X7_PSEFL|nr:RDD family protein [Pseudomonas fluorescens]ROO10201.1 hypothetical protein BK673_10615 [Pseudomonas fluorescens]WRH91390.1 RDD family protein [Pseudomonas fluorescens]
MSKNLLTPQGDFPPVGLGRRLAAMFYDFLLCTALLIVTGGIYKMIQATIIGEERLRVMTDAGQLDGDPLYSTVLVLVLFGFFAKFWTHGGQTLGMQVWGIRVQNTDGTAISLWQALLRFMVSIASWLCVGLGFFWSLYDKQKRTWHDIYSDTRVVRVPKKTK